MAWDTSLLNGPTNLAVASISGSQVHLTWQDNSLVEHNYLVEQTQPNSSWQQIGQTLPQNAESATIAGTFDPSTTYQFRVSKQPPWHEAQPEDREYMWIASAVSLKDLDTPFTNRFIKIPIELPTIEELIAWTINRCREFEIAYDSQETLSTLAERADTIPGHVLQVLARASCTPDRRLTMQLVQKHIFKA